MQTHAAVKVMYFFLSGGISRIGVGEDTVEIENLEEKNVGSSQTVSFS